MNYRPHFAIAALQLAAISVPVFTLPALAGIIEAVTENVSQAYMIQLWSGSNKTNTTCNKLYNVTLQNQPVRGGTVSFRHQVERCGERSEFRMKNTDLGGTYWYGWSQKIPTQWQSTDEYDIIGQFPAYPTTKNFRIDGGQGGCGAAGSYFMRSDNAIAFYFQRQSENTSKPIVCTPYNLFTLDEVKGKWVDYVMQVKWTGNKDGFLKLWTRVQGGSYQQQINYAGRTFWNDEEQGPYFKMGLYKGDPNYSGYAPRVLETDEYRLGDIDSNFNEVAPR